MRLLAFFSVLALLFGGAGIYVLNASRGMTHEGKPVSVFIEPGSSAAQIAAQLQRKDVINAAWLFKLVARIDGRAGALKPGEYELRTGMSYGEVLDVLAAGPAIVETSVTVPEGKTVIEIAKILGDKTKITADAFLAAARSGSHRLAIMPAGSRNLEGLLFPKTYRIREGATADDVVQMMLNQFTEETKALDFSKPPVRGLTPYQIIVIAGMIEREAKVPQDRAKIAAVIYNRLRRPMRLQIDATVQYAYLLRTGRYRNPLTTDDYKISSPYNTYQIDGVPPAPIASPGLASIQAALAPEKVDYLYYVLINSKGEHAFARTYEEFLRLKQQAKSG
jgi:peptidoglycan lytic transglycosylase G